jgi:hypothetical protein
MCDELKNYKKVLKLEMHVIELKTALRRIANWNELPIEFSINRGSNGERDYYRKIADEAQNLFIED